jgi:hypothetical protein
VDVGVWGFGRRMGFCICFLINVFCLIFVYYFFFPLVLEGGAEMPLFPWVDTFLWKVVVERRIQAKLLTMKHDYLYIGL